MGELLAFLAACIAEDDDWTLLDRPKVLREVAAKRRILARHSSCGFGAGYCGDGGHSHDGRPGCPELDDMVSVYAGRPGYQARWNQVDDPPDPP